MSFIKRLAPLTALLFLFLVPAVVGAQEVIDPELCQQKPDATLCVSNKDPQERTNNTVFGQNGVLTKVAQLIALVVGIVAVIMVIIGGLQYVIASGDPTNIQNAKNTIFYALIGLAIAATAQAIISFVLKKII